MYTATAPTFMVRHYSEHGYQFTEIHIRQQYRNLVSEQLEGCVDNKAGYQSAQIAARQAEKFRGIVAAGHVHTYDSISIGGLEVTIKWQHYDDGTGNPDYCDPSYSELGRGIRDIEKGLAFVKKTGGVIERQRAKQTGGDRRKVSDYSFAQPERVLAALRSMKDLIEVEHNRDLDACVEVRSPVASSEAA